MMTMTLDNHQQHKLGALSPNHMASYSNAPQFTNPWVAGSAAQQQQQQQHHHAHQQPQHHQPTAHHSAPNLFHHGMNANLGGLDAISKQHAANRASVHSNSAMASYGNMPVTTASPSSTLTTADMYGQRGLLSMGQDLIGLSRMPTSSAAYVDSVYASSGTTSPVHATYSTSSSPFDTSVSGYGNAPMRSNFDLAGETDSKRGILPDDRRSFADALDAGQGMLAMSQETPRAIYPPAGTRSRGSADSYGFPSTHSSSSSISSASNYSSNHNTYYAGSIDSSVSDYSTAGSDIESVSSRTLPRPNLMSQPPPAPQSMMGQFSSKIASSTQKKHKCKVCDKRFTRPSSLQTHMYSHTGEKPFACEVEGCGRNFSVVSNLRRHRKVHKNEGKSDVGSPDDNQDSD